MTGTSFVNKVLFYSLLVATVGSHGGVLANKDVVRKFDEVRIPCLLPAT
jgi:hypothetical protein